MLLLGFSLAAGGSLGCYLLVASWLQPGLGRRVVLGSLLLSVAGLVSVFPTVPAASSDQFYALAVLLGTPLLALAAIFRVTDRDSIGRIRVPATVQSHLAGAGGCPVVAGGIGVLFGEEVLFVCFSIVVAVAIMLLFLFR